MVAFNTVKPGDVLYSVYRAKQGNTNMTRAACIPVRILSVDAEKRTVEGSVNGNRTRTYTERMLARLRRTRVKEG